MPFPPPTPEAIALVRRRYAEGVTVARILAETPMSHGTFYLWVDGGPDDGGGRRLPPLPRRRVVVGKRRRPLKGERCSLVARLWRTAERQVRDIEVRLARDQQEPAERERDARVLAVLVKTLRELTALDEAKADMKSQPEAPAADDDAVPRDLDELRRELARRVDRLRQRRAADGPAGGSDA
jgi:hypothetical protein